MTSTLTGNWSGVNYGGTINVAIHLAHWSNILILRFWNHALCCHLVTLELRKGHQLITHGIYHSIRHPMYASIRLWCLAQGLLLENWLAGWYAFVAFALMYFIRTPREEQMMGESFGQEYRDYMRQTGRLFPRTHIKPDG